MKTIVMLLTIGSMALYAQTFNVSTTEELRTALQNAAQNGEDDTIVLADGTYTTTDDGLGTFKYLDNEIYDLTLIGSSAENVILSGAGQDQIFNHQSVITANLNIEKLTFIDGGEDKTDRTIKGGGFEVLNAEVQITDCNFTNNHAIDGGGFYAPHYQVNMKIVNTTFSDNSALGHEGSSNEGRGGGFYAVADKLALINTKFSNNRATIKEAYYSGNGYGGGFANTGSATINSSTFTNNVTDGEGGGFYTRGNVKIVDSNFAENSAYSLGNAGASNESINGLGGGFRAYDGGVSTENSRFYKNIAGSKGGGFYATNGSLHFSLINKSSFTENATRSYYADCQDGGAGFVSYDFLTVVVNSIIKGNHSTCQQGAIQTGNAIIVNSTISNNYSQFGSVILANKLYMSNSVMNANSSGISIRLGTVDDPSVIKNTLFLDNNDSIISSQWDFESPIISLKNNYMTTDKVSIQKFVSRNIYDNVTLGFADEANEDYHLTASSDLIDAGTNDYADKFVVDGVNYLARDYEEHNRSVGASMDIGIYEYSTTKPTIIDFTFTGEAKEYQELTFDVSYHLTDGRTVQSVEYDYMNDGNFVTTDTHTYNEAKTYTVHARVTDDVGEYSLRTIRVQIEQLAYEDMTDEQKLKEAVDPQYYDDIQGIIDTAIADAEQSGQQYVIDNPSDFNLGDINEIEVRCRMNPQSCGITPKVVVIPL